MGEWQPIETAPRDAADILVFVPRKHPCQTCIVHWTNWGGGVWEHSSTGLKLGDYPEPTHWMPLPSPPSSEGGA